MLFPCSWNPYRPRGQDHVGANIKCSCRRPMGAYRPIGRVDAEEFSPGKAPGQDPRIRTLRADRSGGFFHLSDLTCPWKPGLESRNADRSDLLILKFYGDIVQRKDLWPATRKSRFESEYLHHFAAIAQWQCTTLPTLGRGVRFPLAAPSWGHESTCQRVCEHMLCGDGPGRNWPSALASGCAL